MAADTTNTFEFDGRKYEVPDYTELDINDWEIVYDECEVVLADFQEVDVESITNDKEREVARKREAERMKRIRNPRLEKAFIMIALRRERPDDDLDVLREEAGKVKLIPYLTSMASGDEAENPTPAKKPDGSSSRSSDSSNENSSLDSDESSETPEDRLATIGTDG